MEPEGLPAIVQHYRGQDFRDGLCALPGQLLLSGFNYYFIYKIHIWKIRISCKLQELILALFMLVNDKMSELLFS